MAAPSKVDEFLDLVRKSGVVDEKRLEAYLQKLRAGASLPDDLGRLAGILVRDGILTHFQAEQFLLGKWRRFTIGKYKVLERLGSGGMGSVYLCEHKFMRRRVAVKVLPAAKADDPAALERFYREARAVAALDHPNIVRAYDIDQDEKLHFLVMEYVDGASLQEIIKKHGPMDITRAAHYIQQAAIGLQHAHQIAGLVHRDIKPGNVLVDRNGVVKVLDMGLARFFHDEEDILTKKYDENVLGTADYLAPEQALDSHSVDIRADIYSLGATFYFVLTGSTPFTEGTVAQKLIWHQTRQPKPIRTLRAEVPEQLAAVLDKMMAKDPAQRYQTPADVVTALNPWTQQTIPPPPDKEMPRLSPAAMGAETVMMNAPSSPTATASSPSVPASPAPAPQKTAPAPAAKPPSAPVPASTKPAAAKPAAAAAAVAATRPAANVVAPTPMPTPIPSKEGNGQAAADTAKEPAPAHWDLLEEEADSSAKRGPAVRPVSSLPSWISENHYYIQFRDHPYFWYVVGGAGATFFLFLVIVFASITRGTKKDGQKPPTTGTTNLIVTQADKKDAFRTIREALKQAKPGDRIVVQDDTIDEPLALEAGSKVKDVTIVGESSDGGRVTWTCEKPVQGKFISLIGVEGLKFKNFNFDGKDRIQDLVSAQVGCPGLSFEDVNITGFTRAGVSLFNCYGKPDERITFTRVRVIAGAAEKQSAVVFAGRNTIAPTQYVTFSECRFEGQYKSTLQFEASALDIEFRRNRFYNSTGDAVLYKVAVPRHKLQVVFDSNTFSDNKRGLFLEDVPDLKTANSFRITWKNNLFARTATLAAADKAKPEDIKALKPLVEVSKNVCGKDCKEGNLPLDAAVVDFPPLPTDANADDFLIYPKTSPLYQLPEKPGVAPE